MTSLMARDRGHRSTEMDSVTMKSDLLKGSLRRPFRLPRASSRSCAAGLFGTSRSVLARPILRYAFALPPFSWKRDSTYLHHAFARSRKNFCRQNSYALIGFFSYPLQRLCQIFPALTLSPCFVISQQGDPVLASAYFALVSLKSYPPSPQGLRRERKKGKR